jgi:hypothetical protein
VCDDLAELTAGSIYTKRERWQGIGTMTRGGRRRGSFTGAMNPWHLLWQSFRRSTESHNGSRRCGGGTQARGTRPEGGGHRRGDPILPWHVRYSGRICLLAGVIHDDVTPSVIRSTRARIDTTAARITEERLSAVRKTELAA